MSVSCDGYADIHQERRVVARKTHDCDACEIPIRPGDVYHKEDWLYDGGWSHNTRCSRCQVIYEHLLGLCRSNQGYDMEFPEPALDCGHEYKERWEVEPPEWLAALAFWLPGDPLPALNACSPEAHFTRSNAYRSCLGQPFRNPRYYGPETASICNTYRLIDSQHVTPCSELA